MLNGKDEHGNGSGRNGSAPPPPPSDDVLAEFETRSSGVYSAQHPGYYEEPPFAPETEKAVLSMMLLDWPHAVRVADVLSSDHFFGEAHRRIFESAAKLVGEGCMPDVPMMLDRLRASQRLEQIGGARYLTDVIQWASVEFPFDRALEQLDDLHRRRRFIRSCQEFTAHGYLNEKPVEELLDGAQRAIVELASSTFRRALPVLEGVDLGAPLPELPWLVPTLGIAPGPPVMVAGSGYSRKTLALQSLAVSVAAGKPAWGVYSVRQGAVLHIDYEQGRRVTVERYQRLARAMGVDLARMPLQVAVSPDMHLDAPGAEATLSRACKGKALVLIDSFRASCPTADENSSEMRQHLDMLGRVSERTAASILVIHHAKKPTKEQPGGDKFSIRGSGALFEACGGVFIFSGEKGNPTTVHHEKERNRGQTVEDFGIDAVDVDEPETGQPGWGLRIVHLEGEQLAEAAAGRVGDRSSRIAECVGRVLGVLATSPGMSKREIRAAVKGDCVAVDTALDQLIRTQKIENRGDRRGAKFHVV